MENPKEKIYLFKFPRSERPARKEIRLVFLKGKKTTGRSLKLYSFEQKGAGRKASFIVKKFKKSAVERNRYKRILREIYRLNKNALKPDVWLVLIALKPLSEAGAASLETEFIKICREAGIII